MAVDAPRLLGLDLAWSPRNPSGVAVLDAQGVVLDARADVVSDDDILAWVRTWRGTSGIIGIDMPTIVTNPEGRRPCEAAVARVFARHHAAPHPANLKRFPDGGRARHLIDALAADGVVETLDVVAHDPRLIALEVFPHPAHVRLFALDKVFRYKKKARPWPLVLAEWSRYRAALASLAHAEPPLVLDERIPLTVETRGYKRWDDTLDAISCAYIAAFVYRFGLAGPEVAVYGDLSAGYIVIPERALFRPAASREESVP